MLAPNLAVSSQEVASTEICDVVFEGWCLIERSDGSGDVQVAHCRAGSVHELLEPNFIRMVTLCHHRIDRGWGQVRW